MARASQPFSVAWTVVSVVLFCAIEIAIGGYVGPQVVGKYVSPQLHLKLQMLMNLGSYFLGGILVGVLSPRVRLLEPAVGAFISVAVVLLMGLFLPWTWMQLSMSKLLLGGGIAFVLGLAGAYTGEKWMGNVGDDPTTLRGRVRHRMWGDDGLLSRGEDRLDARRR